jgi:hypothetical protein
MHPAPARTCTCTHAPSHTGTHARTHTRARTVHGVMYSRGYPGPYLREPVRNCSACGRTSQVAARRMAAFALLRASGKPGAAVWLFAAAGGRCNVVGCIASPRMQREGHGADRAEPRRGRYDRAAPALVRTHTAATARGAGLYCNRYQCEARRRRAAAPGASMCGRCGCPCAPGVRVRERAFTGVCVCLPLNARRVPRLRQAGRREGDQESIIRVGGRGDTRACTRTPARTRTLAKKNNSRAHATCEPERPTRADCIGMRNGTRHARWRGPVAASAVRACALAGAARGRRAAVARSRGPDAAGASAQGAQRQARCDGRWYARAVPRVRRPVRRSTPPSVAPVRVCMSCGRTVRCTHAALSSCPARARPQVGPCLGDLCRRLRSVTQVTAPLRVASASYTVPSEPL